MYRGKVFDKGFGEASHKFRREIHPARFLSAQDDASDALHHVEGHPEYRFILAKQKRTRNFLVDGKQMREDAILSAHVVRSFDLRSDRRTAQDEFAMTGTQQVSEIGKAGGKLFND